MGDRLSVSLAATMVLLAVASGAPQALQPVTEASAHYPSLLDGMVVTLRPGQVQLSGLRLEGGTLRVAVLPGRVETAIRLFPSRVVEPLAYTKSYDMAARSYTVTAALPDTVPVAKIDGAVVWCDGCASGAGNYSGALAHSVPPWQLFAPGANVVMFGLSDAVPPPRRRARALLQQANCALAVGAATPETFAGCTTINTAPEVPFQVFYTLSPSAKGTEWRGGLRVSAAAANGQWAGLGFPLKPSTMIGANAVVVKECATCPSGASVDGYHLLAYSSARNVPGSFPIRDATAAKADGALVASFTVDLPQPPAALMAGPLNVIYAVGPLAAGGNLSSHAVSTFPYGGTKLQLAALAPSLPLAAPGPEAAPVPVLRVPAAEPAPAAEPTGGGTGPTGGGTGPAGDCSLAIDGSQRRFAGCAALKGLSSGLKVLCTVGQQQNASGEPPPTQPSTRGNVSLQMGISAAGVPPGSWVAVGFPATPGAMVGATAMVLAACASCPKGAKLQDYFLAAKSEDGVAPPGRLGFSELTAAATPGGGLQGSFTVELPPSMMFIFAGSRLQLPLIYASGPLDASGRLQYHNQQQSATTLNLPSGPPSGDASTIISVSSPRSSRQAKLNAHAWLMVVGWTIILGAAVAAHSFRYGARALWFHLHRGAALLGLACVLAGFILIFTTLGRERTTYTVHYNLGVAATTLGLAQVLALVKRPHLDSRWRRAWALAHHWVGRSAVVLAVANIYYGMINVQRVGAWAVISYSVVFGLIVGVGILKDSVDYLRLPPPALLHRSYGSAQEEREAGRPGPEAQALVGGAAADGSGHNGDGSKGSVQGAGVAQLAGGQV